MVSFTNNRTTFVEYVKRTTFIPLMDYLWGTPRGPAPTVSEVSTKFSMCSYCDALATQLFLGYVDVGRSVSTTGGSLKSASSQSFICASVHGSVYYKFDPSAESKNTISSGGAVCTNNSSIVKRSTIQYDNRNS